MKSVLILGIPGIVSLFMLQCQAFLFRQIIVSEPGTFPCTCSGKCPVVQWILFIPSKATIAESKMCHNEWHFEKGFSLSGNASKGDVSLTINSVTYNHAGSYRCICNGKSATEVKLKVIVPTVIKVFERENVTLPCYGDTRHNVQDVTWMKAGQKVLLYNHANGSVTTADASESRLTMSGKGFQDGHLSLHIASVDLSDAGLYQCLLHDESQDGYPNAVLLKVERRQQLSTTDSYEVLILRGLLGSIVFVGVIGLIVNITRRCCGKSVDS
ncbi:uncharacterized protein LOC132869176 isoform X2 [Neoarius graeffei]|uniref:uncharacterized protein LOC132869176 isoform X2 n=1 Tax=Neoarius graeffei TaxID=443677 RepID=UPI00298CC062|nr:uncharacterized protein LOC132869176 isoform X2 [Neoarius graeffei]